MQTREQSLREHNARRHRYVADQHPSFSSTLLDSIYCSIDEPYPRAGSSHPSSLFRDLRPPGKKHPFLASAREEEEEEEEAARQGENFARLRRNRGTLGRWMEKKMCNDRVVLRRNSVAATDMRSRSDSDHRSGFVLSSSSSSSNSSSGGRFSSSESESASSRGGAKTRSLCCDAPWPKPIRTRVSVRSHTSPPKHPPSSSSSDARFSLVKTKEKALRIYDDLKKVKQPISPGNRLASFLNSLLASKNSKKSKISSSLKQCDETAEVSTSGDGGMYQDGALEKKSKSGNGSNNSKASYGMVLERKSKYVCENKDQKIPAPIDEGTYEDAISFSRSKLISSDALKNTKIASSVGSLDDGAFERKSNPERGQEPAYAPLPRSRSGPSGFVPWPGERSVNSFMKIRSVRFNLPEEDEQAAAPAAPTRARGSDGVGEAVRDTTRSKKSDHHENGGFVARDRNAEEDDGYSSSDLFELDNLTVVGHCR